MDPSGRLPLLASLPGRGPGRKGLGETDKSRRGQVGIILDIRKRVQVNFLNHPPGGLLPKKRLLCRLGHSYLVFLWKL